MTTTASAAAAVTLWTEPVCPETVRRELERVVDARTNTIRWEYSEPTLLDLFSPYISGTQRLGNAHTLICEGCHGRIFEVTHEGEVVWDYVSPCFVHEPFFMPVAAIVDGSQPHGLND